jgi:hypothetical protein
MNLSTTASVTEAFNGNQAIQKLRDVSLTLSFWT